MSNFFGTGLNQSPRNFELGEAAYWDLDQLKQIILVDTNVDLSDIRQSITNLDNATLKKSANLSDLTNKATARDNLGLGNISTLNYSTSYFDVSSGSLVLNQSVRNSLGLADTSVQKSQISQGTGPSQTHVMSQKAVTDAFNLKVTKDDLSYAGFVSSDVSRPYFRHETTDQVVELARADQVSGFSSSNLITGVAKDVTHTNTKPRGIFVYIRHFQNPGSYITVRLNGVDVFPNARGGEQGHLWTLFVPSGFTYFVSGDRNIEVMKTE